MVMRAKTMDEEVSSRHEHEHEWVEYECHWVRDSGSAVGIIIEWWMVETFAQTR